MAKKSQTPPAPEPKPKSDQKSAKVEELPLIAVVGMERVEGGWVAISAVIQGDRVVSKQIHNPTPQLKEYAVVTLKTVTYTKVVNPKGKMINVEDDANGP